MDNELYLMIDDVREGIGIDLVARTAETARMCLSAFSITHLLLDNDLGIDQDMEGIDILGWARDNDAVPPNVRLVTMNPVARKRMEALLENDLGYTVDKETGWWRKPE